MKLGVASCIFILCGLFLLMIAHDSSARKITKGSGKDIRLKEIGVFELQQRATDDHIGTLASAVHSDQDGNMEMHTNHVHKDDDQEHDDGDDDDSDDEEEEDDNDGDSDDEEEEDDHKKIKEKHMSGSSHMNHMNPAVKVFFNLIDLKVGKTIPIYLHKTDPSTSPKLLSREEADQIPFSLKQLNSLLRFFSFPKHSPQAKAIKYTLKLCELKPIKEETKSCATSLESMLDFAHFTFGPDTQFKVLTTTNLTKSTVLSQNYTILEVKEISAPKMVACHIMPYPYAIFYCHSQETQNKLFEVSIGGENGEGIQTAAVCHMDTSYWDRKHVAFHVLRVEVGSPVCHFVAADTLVWLPLPAAL